VAAKAAGLGVARRLALLEKAVRARRALARLAARDDATAAIHELHALAIQNTAYGSSELAAKAAGLDMAQRRALLAKTFRARRALARLAARAGATTAIREAHARAIQSTAYGASEVAADAAGLDAAERLTLLAKAFAACVVLARLVARSDATLVTHEARAAIVQATANGSKKVVVETKGLDAALRLALLVRARATVVELDSALANARSISQEPQLACLMDAWCSVGYAYGRLGYKAEDTRAAGRITEIASRPGLPNLPPLMDRLLQPPLPDGVSAPPDGWVGTPEAVLPVVVRFDASAVRIGQAPGDVAPPQGDQGPS
jgi:hypothetical protein